MARDHYIEGRGGESGGRGIDVLVIWWLGNHAVHFLRFICFSYGLRGLYRLVQAWTGLDWQMITI